MENFRVVSTGAPLKFIEQKNEYRWLKGYLVFLFKFYFKSGMIILIKKVLKCSAQFVKNRLLT